MSTSENSALPLQYNDPISRTGIHRVIVASSLGTLFEWYDFFLYGSLAGVFGRLFFPPGNDAAGILAALATFGAGFAVRPVGALFFGRFGDIVGRKITFLTTMLLMGGSTVAVGFLPTFSVIGWASPITLVALRLVQGFALGGEYGGAAIYVAEHAHPNRRGSDTSWLQTTSTVGLFCSIVVISLCMHIFGGVRFAAWGWRVPFLLSLPFLVFSTYLRARLQESPVFREMKEQGKNSTRPLTDSFCDPVNLRRVLIALFGCMIGVTMISYTGQFYPLYFLTNTLKVDQPTTYLMMAIALLLSVPSYVLSGMLSDRIGRKWIIMAACALATLTYFPIFKGLTHFANPGLEAAQETAPVVISVNPASCSFHLFSKPVSECDKAKNFFAAAGISYTNAATPNASDVIVSIGNTQITGFQPDRFKEVVRAAGYPEKASNQSINFVAVTLLLTLLISYFGLCYGPLAAFLVELFPARVRYTSMSLPYHLATGTVGGFVPFFASALVIKNGDIYFGLWYPICGTALSFVVGLLFIKETFMNDIRH